MSDSKVPVLTDKEQAFVHWYCLLLNGTEAMARAGYGNENTSRPTLAAMASEYLRKPHIKAEIDRYLEASIASADEVLSRISQQALADIGAYYKDDGTLDLAAMREDGMEHLVVGASKGREGVTWALAHPQTAQKLMARYHRLLRDQVDVTLEDRTMPTKETLDSLVQQVAALEQQADSGGDAQENDDA